jgi:hypothetical protein
MNTVNWSSKITVIVLFGLRLPCIAFMAATAAGYGPIEHDTARHTSAIAPAAIWSEVLLGYALSSASFPCIRTFLTAFLFDSKYRIGASSMASYNQGSRSGPHRQTGTRRSTRVVNSQPDEHPPDKAESIASDASQKMILIKKSVDVEMTIEAASSGAKARHEGHPKFPYQGPCF